MKTCEKCYGSGLVGQGANPHLREGRTKTCDACAGTGKVAEGGTSTPSNEGGSTEPAPGDAPVDNSDDEPAPKRGILSRIFSRRS